jgi:hypothetical protein
VKLGWDAYGAALAVGDPNGDGFDDLAVGAPNYDGFDNVVACRSSCGGVSRVFHEGTGLVAFWMGRRWGLIDDPQVRPLSQGRNPEALIGVNIDSEADAALARFVARRFGLGVPARMGSPGGISSPQAAVVTNPRRIPGCEDHRRHAGRQRAPSPPGD